MNVFEWLSLINSYILCIAAIYQLAVISVFTVLAMRIGNVRALDDLLPEDSDN